MKLQTLLACALIVVGSASAQTPEEQADELIAQMTDMEKYSMLNGRGWEFFDPLAGYYIGNTPAIERLGIPSINMHDAGQGFRTVDSRMIGQVTAWPCVLAGASTWDADLIGEWAMIMGKEFRLKGSNVLLGPSVNLHRVPRGGRNAEYISGESPYLGYELTRRYVQGLQAEGVMAVVKHFVVNNQETNRNDYDAIVSPRVLNEIYYPPYQGAVDADVAAAMCAYNVVNGVRACGNKDTIVNDFREKMGFKGWMMSDWWATYATWAEEGLDQEMPGTDAFPGHGRHWYGPENLSRVNPDTINAMVKRVLTPMIASGAIDWTPCENGNDCDAYLYEVNTRSPGNTEFARRLAADSIIMLQNNNNTLPLSSTKYSSIAIVGSACDAEHDVADLIRQWDKGNYYIVGGSGRVIPPTVVSITEGVRARASQSGITIIEERMDNVQRALQAIGRADVAIICGGTKSTEDADRANLSLDQESFINSVTSQTNKPIVVLMTTPGPVLTPFRSDSQAVLNMFLGGEQTGTAWADVLFGDVSPSGKLPVTFPDQELDVTQPCQSLNCPYTDGLFMGWRGLVDKRVAYPFGHGLSYIDIAYSWRTAPNTDCNNGALVCMQVDVANNDQTMAGAEVLQMYMGFPANEGEPEMVLRGFQKVTLQPGQNSTVAFSLNERDMSVFDESQMDWRRSTGMFNFYVAASSRDVRLQSSLVMA